MAQDALNATPTELYEMTELEIYFTAMLRKQFYEEVYGGE